jgi:tetratricopeptide (TPR) repeat protein
MKRLAWLSFEGLDWDLLQALVDAGRMPCVAQLIAAGSSGPMAVPPPALPASIATSLATGVLADRHGVCHALAPRSDGLLLGAIGLESVRSPSCWLIASQQGRPVRVAGWPASLPADPSQLAQPLPAHAHIAGQGFELAANATVDHWPLSPDVVWPDTLRAAIGQVLIHPDEIDDDTILPLCGDITDAAVRQAAREFIARAASVQALGLCWLDEDEAAFLALRFEGLSAWTRTLHQHTGVRLAQALAPTYRWLDLLVGRWMHTLGRDAHLLVTTEGRLPGAGYRRASNRGPGAGGGLVLAGPDVPVDALFGPASALDVCPTVLALQGLLDAPGADAFDGRNLLAESTRTGDPGPTPDVSPLASPPRADGVDQDADALAWLAQNGIAPIDAASMREAVERVRNESRRTWAGIRRLRGRLDEACDVLRTLLQRTPEDTLARLMLAEALLAADRPADCAALGDGLPTNGSGLVWEGLYALLDYARKDWPALETRLSRLEGDAQAWVNPAAWLGWSLLARGETERALEAFERAAQRPQEPLRVWEGMGRTWLQLGRPDQAIACFDRTIAEQPYAAELHRLRGDALQAAGQRASALAAWLRAWTLAPALPGLAAQLGRAAQQQLARLPT